MVCYIARNIYRTFYKHGREVFQSQTLRFLSQLSKVQVIVEPGLGCWTIHPFAQINVYCMDTVPFHPRYQTDL